MYSPEHSLNGAKLLANKSAVRRPTVESMASAELQPHIITPHALPMFRDGEDGKSTKRKREKERMDPRKSRRPELPVTGPGKGGRVGASATQHVVQNLVRDTTRDQDVRSIFLLMVSDFSFCAEAPGVTIRMFWRLCCEMSIPSDDYPRCAVTHLVLELTCPRPGNTPIPRLSPVCLRSMDG